VFDDGKDASTGEGMAIRTTIGAQQQWVDAEVVKSGKEHSR
jgi:hypothetical protein